MPTHDVTMENFESTIDQNEMVILDFWAAWCGPCRAFAPVFESASDRHPQVFFGKVNTEMATELATAFQVRSIPTIMAFKGTELVFEQAGALPGPLLEDLIGKLKDLQPSPDSRDADPAADQPEPH